MILLTPLLKPGEERYFAFSMTLDADGRVAIDVVSCQSADAAARASELLMVPSGRQRLCRGGGIAIGAAGMSLALPCPEMLSMPLSIIVAATGNHDAIAQSIVSAVCGTPKLHPNRRLDPPSSN